MGTFGTRKRCGSDAWSGRIPRSQLDLDALVAKQLDAGTPMNPSTPVTPEERLISDDERMQEHAHLARLGSGAAIPLTLFAQRAGATTPDAGRIHHTQTAIGFSAPLMRGKLLASRATECAIWLKSKVLTREAASFPGQGHGCRPVPLNRSLRVGFLFVSKWESRSKLGGAHWGGSKLMAQFQAEVPHPLADELPYLLTRCGMACPPVGVVLLCAA
jgi:hypothetical protein